MIQNLHNPHAYSENNIITRVVLFNLYLYIQRLVTVVCLIKLVMFLSIMLYYILFNNHWWLQLIVVLFALPCVKRNRG